MAHNSTIFGQMLKLVQRHEFERLACKHKAGRKSRKLPRWGQFVAMEMAQLAGRCSLRDIVSNLGAQSRTLYHLGIGEVSRSSLARVNAEKSWELYGELFGVLPVGVAGARLPVREPAVLAVLDGAGPVPVGVSVGEVPADEGRSEGARGAGGGRVGNDCGDGEEPHRRDHRADVHRHGRG